MFKILLFASMASILFAKTSKSMRMQGYLGPVAPLSQDNDCICDF